MHILVAGDGAMAVRLVEALMKQHQVVCLHPPDSRSWHLEQLDAEIIAGELSSPQVLESAGVGKKDVFIACTRNDDQNIVAAMAAKKLGAKKTICVLMRRGFLTETGEGVELAASFGIDHIVRPIDQLAEEILRIVTVPGALEVEQLAGGRISLLRYAVEGDARIIGRPLSEIALPKDVLLVHVRRGDDLIMPRGSTVLERGDKVIAMGFQRGLAKLGPLLLSDERRAQRREAAVIGGGRVGRAVALGLSQAKWRVTIVEVDQARCEVVSQRVDALVLHGDGADVEFLEQEQIGDMPVVITVTNSDEKNLLVSLLLKQLGNPRTITRADRLTNERLFEKVGVDVVRSAKGAAIRSVIRLVDPRESEILAELEHGSACVLEVTLPAEMPRQLLSELRMPAFAVVGAILRSDKTIIPTGRDDIRPGDHLFIVCARTDESRVRDFLHAGAPAST